MVDLAAVSEVAIAVGISLIVGYIIGRVATNIQKAAEIHEARVDGADRSRSSLGGKVLEQIGPYLPDFPYDPTEIRHLGDPIDYVVFRGYRSGSIQEVVLLEIKSGKSRLNSVQRQIRDVVQAGKVRWDEYRPVDRPNTQE